LATPFIYTWLLNYCNFKEHGVLGDTIGGLSSPAIGLLSAYLVYRAFEVQHEANNLILEGRTEDLFVENCRFLIERFEKRLREFERSTIYGTEYGEAALKREFDEINTSLMGLSEIPRLHLISVYKPDLDPIGEILWDMHYAFNYIVTHKVGIEIKEFYIRLFQIKHEKFKNELDLLSTTMNEFSHRNTEQHLKKTYANIIVSSRKINELSKVASSLIAKH
jgi:hypothetical protein